MRVQISGDNRLRVKISLLDVGARRWAACWEGTQAAVGVFENPDAVVLQSACLMAVMLLTLLHAACGKIARIA